MAHGREFLERFPFGANQSRSVPYSLVCWALSFAKFWPLVLFQCLAVVGLLDFTSRKFWKGAHPARMFLLVLALSLFTPLAITANFALPDIFTGLLILALYWLGPENRQLSSLEATWMAVAAVLFITFHNGNWPLTAVILVMARTRLLFLALLGASLLMAGLNVLAFGQVRLFSPHPPFALARAMEFGLVQRYLREHPDGSHFQLYAYRRHLPPDSSYFLWARHSPLRRDEEVGRRISSEESALYLAVWHAYPRDCLCMVWQSGVAQLGCLEFWEVNLSPLPRYLKEALGPQMAYTESTWQARERWPARELTDWTQLLFCVALVLSLFDRRVPRPLLLWCLIALIANAFICGGISGVYGRYHTRILWLGLLPLLLTWLRPREPDPTAIER